MQISKYKYLDLSTECPKNCNHIKNILLSPTDHNKNKNNNHDL